ncbi:RNA-binding S4 domain-containing protein [Emcibacter sp. SYSU 3D8]|uniref:RNA-binding S4 domain-containing protein n=1 Tax=Emcibacter sp. SYSU 3D8 TaxID=3133969 RepID=UPI0031FE86BF
MQDTALRIDKWLWYARFYKSRSLAAKHVQAGEIRVNSQRISKSSVVLKVGDVLTFALGDTVRVVEVAALGDRRGPAPEARLLYHDLAGQIAASRNRPGIAAE